MSERKEDVTAFCIVTASSKENNYGTVTTIIQSTYLLARDLFVKTMLTEQKEYMVQADKTL